MNDTLPSGILLLVILGAALMAYLLPSMIAFKREHKFSSTILWINLLTGWTFFGWWASLLWAINTDTEKTV